MVVTIKVKNNLGGDIRNTMAAPEFSFIDILHP